MTPREAHRSQAVAIDIPVYRDRPLPSAGRTSTGAQAPCGDQAANKTPRSLKGARGGAIDCVMSVSILRHCRVR